MANSPNTTAAQSATKTNTSVLSVNGEQFVAINSHQQIPLALTAKNYPSWRNLVVSLFNGYNLFGYLDGSISAPPLGEYGVWTDDYTQWFRQDQLILAALLGSLSAEVMPLVAAANTSHKAWSTLSRLYATKSRTRVLQLKEDLALATIGNMYVATFLQHIKSKTDELSVIDKPVSDDDITLYVLTGLGAAYREIAASIRAREHSLSFEELHDLTTAIDHL